MSDTIKTGNYRWTVCALIFFATTVNYIDRQVIGILKPLLESDLGIGEKAYSQIIMAFQLSYAVGMVIAGRLIDKFGTKLGYGASVVMWSIAAMGHALAKGTISFGFWRALLGVSEAGNFPAAIKTVAEWFPKKERAFATGIFDASTSVGAILAPFIVGAVVTVEGANWQIPFLFTGVLSSIWVVLWLRNYKKPELHPKLSKEELAYVNSDSDEETTEKIPWLRLFPKRETWAFALTTLTDGVWWFYLFWGAKFLGEQFGVDINNIGIPFLIIFVMADAGSLLGGLASGALIKKGWSINKARKITMLVNAIIILPVAFVTVVASKWLAVFLIGFAAAGHQSWSINGYTLVSDVFPKKATASVTGIGKMVGVAMAIIADIALGAVLDTAGNSGYFWAFMIAGFSYICILVFVHLLMPRMTPLDDNLNYITK